MTALPLRAGECLTSTRNREYRHVMKTLSIDDLHALRLAIDDNAADLHREADLLLQHSMFSRAYLLAHFCIEELGKIPIIVGVAGSLVRGEKVDWKQANRRFSSHVEKIASQNGHSYAFGAKLDALGNSDVQSLVAANRGSTKVVREERSFHVRRCARREDISTQRGDCAGRRSKARRIGSRVLARSSTFGEPHQSAY